VSIPHYTAHSPPHVTCRAHKGTPSR
jgi:hypothetical protein